MAIVNPLRARLFAESIGALAKTDPVDARMLALFGQMTGLTATPPLPEAMENIREIVRAREAAVWPRWPLKTTSGPPCSLASSGRSERRSRLPNGP